MTLGVHEIGPGPVLNSFRTFTTFRTFRTLASTHLLLLRSSLRSVIPVLSRADIRHAPLVAVPAVEAVHVESPETAVLIADDDQTVGVADVDAPGAFVHAVAAAAG